MRTYETVFITLPTLTEDEEKGVVAAFAQVLKDSGATLVGTDRMGRRRLAYPIQKFEDGVYTRFLYDAEAAVPHELERRMRISDRVIRHLTVHLERDWAVAAKEQIVRDAIARAEAEARRAAEAEAAAAAGEAAAPPADVPAERRESGGFDDDEVDEDDGDEDDDRG